MSSKAAHMVEFIVASLAKGQVGIVMILLSTGSFLFAKIYCATSQTLPPSATSQMDLWLPIFPRPVCG